MSNETGSVVGYLPIAYTWDKWGSIVNWYYYKKSSFEWFKSAVAEVSGKEVGSFSCSFSRTPFCQANSTSCHLIAFDSDWLPELRVYYNKTRLKIQTKVNLTVPEDLPTYSKVAGTYNQSLPFSSSSKNVFNISSLQCSTSAFTHLAIRISTSKATTFSVSLIDCLPYPTTATVYRDLNSWKSNDDIYISLSKFRNFPLGISRIQISFPSDVVVSLQNVVLVRPEDASKISTGSFTTGAHTTGFITSESVTSGSSSPSYIESSDSDNQIPIIAGSASGGFVLLIVLVGLIIIFFIRRRRFTINKVLGIRCNEISCHRKFKEEESWNRNQQH